MKNKLTIGGTLFFAFMLFACSLFTPAKTHPVVEIKPDRVSPVDGMEMMIVPAGEFRMGSDDGPADMGTDDEKPMHKVWLDAFWIDKYEVSNGQYEKCEKAGVCTVPSETESYTRNTYYGDDQYKDYPVIQINWDMAKIYCKWAGRRLPTEAEWEKAARGTDGRMYPWGNEDPDESLANYFSNEGDTTKVGSYPAGASPYGALDMAGNAMEWTADWHGDDYYSSQSEWRNPKGPDTGTYRSARGGDWLKNPTLISTVTRLTGAGYPVFGNETTGFRCAASVTP